MIFIKTFLRNNIPWHLLRIFRRIYDFVRGYWPPTLGFLVLKIRSRKPETFSKKIMYKMAHDRRPILATFADKVTVRDYVSNTIGDKYLTKCYAIVEKVGMLPEIQLPKEFCMKPSHGSGAVLLVVSDKEFKGRLQVFPQRVGWERFIVNYEEITFDQIIEVSRQWLNQSFWNSNGHYPEWAYKDIERKIIVEELLVVENGIPCDSRFFIFNGVCEYIEVDYSWCNKPSRTMFTKNWDFVDVRLRYPSAFPLPSKPKEIDEMIYLAEKLANGIDHIRVDFYLIGSRVVFGELTNYHTSGLQTFLPDEFNFQFGVEWRPQLHY